MELADRTSGVSPGIAFCKTEEDGRRADATLDSMSPSEDAGSDPRSGFTRSSWKAGGRLNKSTNAGRQCMNTVQDDVVMAGASGTQTVAATDGRSLTIAEWGDPGGFPVLLHAGTPGSRLSGRLTRARMRVSERA